MIRAPLRDLPNLDVMPSSILLFKTEFELAAKGERIRLLGYYLQDNSEFFGRYDYIIIDTNPGLGLVNQNAFFAADSIVLVTDVSDNGLTGVEMFQYLWGEELCTELRIPDVTKGLVSATTTSASSWHPRCSTTSARAKTWAVCSLIPSSRTA